MNQFNVAHQTGARGFSCAVLVLVILWVISVDGSDWPQFLGPQRNGQTDEVGLLPTWPDTGPPQRWQKSIGTGYSAPSIRGDRLVLHHREGAQEIVEALSAESGESLWKHSYPSDYVDPFGYNNGPRCAPVLSENRCYTFGAEGKLCCLDLANGDVIWQRDTHKDWNVPSPYFGVGSTPVLDSGRLLVMVGGQPNSGMVALEPETGRVLWESVGQDNWQGVPITIWPGKRTLRWKGYEKSASYATPVVATVHDRPALFCLMRQGLIGLDPKTGKTSGKFFFRSTNDYSVNAACPVVVGNQVLISNAYYRTGSVLLSVAADGELKPVWSTKKLEIHWATPIHHQGYLYAFSGRNEPDARFICLEWSTGKVLWDRDERWEKGSGIPDVYGRGSLIKAEGRLIVLGESGLLGQFSLNPKKDEELARFQVPGLRYPCWAGPVLSNGNLYLRSENLLVCLNLKAE